MKPIKKPVAPSCERNQKAIFEKLKEILLPTDQNVFEIASGTGQHAVYFSGKFPNITWQTSDLEENHIGINLWIEDSGLCNVVKPITYQAGTSHWPELDIDVVFSANCLHIMSWQNCKSFFEDLQSLKIKSRVVFYGPFNYEGKFTSESNENFDQWLKERQEFSGIRDVEKVQERMTVSGFTLNHDFEMPANNRLLVFQKN